MCNSPLNIKQYVRRFIELDAERRAIEAKIDSLSSTYIRQYALFKKDDQLRTSEDRRGLVAHGTAVDWSHLKAFANNPSGTRQNPNWNPSGITYKLRMLKKATGEETGMWLNSGYPYEEASLKKWQENE